MRMTNLPVELSDPGGPLDTFNSLPAHPLLVHAPVVLIPLCAIGVVVLALVPRWRRKYGALLLIGLAVAAGSAMLAKESGEALAARVGEPERHAELGDILPWIVVALFAITAVWLTIAWRNGRPDPDNPEVPRGSGPFQILFGILAVIAAVLAVVWVYLVGDSGAKAVWSARTPAPAATAQASQSPSATAGASPSAGTAPAGGSSTAAITRAMLAEHSTPQDCWAVVGGKVYDLTKWEAQSAAGAQAIDALCGTDATAAFQAQNSSGAAAEDVLAGTQVGILER
jgi:cytochrome b involved in lipid metabolism